MKSMLDLQLHLLEESGKWTGVDTLNDRKTIIQRFEDEGEEFLTITLPSIVSDLYRALADEKVSDTLFPSFRRKKGEKLPLFMGDFFRILFEPRDGSLINVTDKSRQVLAIRCIVQVTGLCGKLYEQASPKRTDLAFTRYIDNDDRVRDWELFKFNEPETASFLKSLRVTFHELFGPTMARMESDLKFGLIRPFMDPGRPPILFLETRSGGCPNGQTG